jgi:hypothetical protein
MAYVLHASGRPRARRRGRRNGDGARGGNDATPFFTELLRRSVAPMVAEDDAKARAEPKARYWCVRASRRLGRPRVHLPRR